MLRDLVYSPSVDLEPVDQFGFLDVRKAFVSGAVDGKLSIEETSFNGVDDPSTLLHRSKDIFESYRKADAVAGALKKAAESKTSAATSPGE